MAKLGRGIYYRTIDNRYMGKCHAGRDENNSIIYAYVYANSYNEVCKKLEAKRIEVAHQRNIRVYKDGSLGEWIFHYISTLRGSKVKQSTIATYYAQSTNHIMPVLGHLKLCSLTTEQVQNFVETLINKELSPATIKNIYGLFRMVMTKAEYKNMLHVNPCTKDVCLPPLAPKQSIPLTREQQFILEKTNDISVILSLFTGIRLGELCALRIENVNLEKGTIYIDSTVQRVNTFKQDRKTGIMITTPKSKNSVRVIPLPNCLIKLLERHIKADSGYFLTNSEKIVEPRTLQNRFKRLLSECGMPVVNFHLLRHTFATRCLESGMDIKTLSEVLGHANASITMNIYCHSCYEHKKACMEKLEFIKVA